MGTKELSFQNRRFLKAFLDTSGKIFVIAIINEDNKIFKYKIIHTNNDVAMNANYWIEEFFKNNTVDITEIREWYTVLGPGSFTGVKVSANIINTLKMMDPSIKIHVINKFSLIKKKEKENIKWYAIPFGKNKFYIKWKNPIKNLNKDGYKSINKLPNSKGRIDYDEFNENDFYNSIKKFKVVDKVKPIYPRRTF